MVIQIGRGAYSRVYRVKTKDGSEQVCKAVSNRCFSMIETHLMKNLLHPYLMKANWICSSLDYLAPESREKFVNEITTKIQVESCLSLKIVPESLDHVFIFMDEMKGTLEKRELALNFDTKLNRYGLISGLKYLHDQGFVHNDLKNSNILIGQDGKFTISDFSCTDQIGTHSIVFRGTPTSRAPEFFLHPEQPSNPKFDVWSIGLVLLYLETGIVVNCDAKRYRLKNFKNEVAGNPKYEVLRGKKIMCTPQSVRSGTSFRTLFPYGEDDLSALIFIMDEMYYEEDRNRNLSKVKDPILRELIKGMTEPNPEKRLGLDDVLNHEYFNSLPSISGQPSPKPSQGIKYFDTGFGKKVDEVASVVKARITEKNPRLPLALISDAAKSAAINYCLRDTTYFSQGRIDRCYLPLLDSIGFQVS